MKTQNLKQLTINCCGKYFCKPDWQWNDYTTRFNDLDMWVVLSGKGTLHTKDKTYQLKTGDCFILNNSVPFKSKTDPDSPLVNIYIHFDFYDQSGTPMQPDQSNLNLPFYHNITDFSFFVKLLERVLMLHFNGRFTEANNWLNCALLEIKSQDNNFKTYSDDSCIEELCNNIRTKPEQRFILKAEARKAFYSTEHFGRMFKKHTGMSFRDYILKSRIDAATLYLLSTSYSIGRIADILGYNDIYLFSRQFKLKTGKTPTEYRKYHRGN